MGRRLGAIGAIAGVLALAPIVLTESAGAPSLGAFPDLKGIKRAIDLRWIPLEWAITLLALVGWILWGYLAVAVLVRSAAHLEARFSAHSGIRKTSEAITWSPIKTIVDVAFGAVLLASTVTSGRAASRGDGWAGTIASQVAQIRSSPIAEDPIARAAGEEERGRHSPPRRTTREYVVKPGDSLWSIAETELRDPYRWVELWELNRGRDVGGGHRLEKPGFIRPGWTLRLPEPPGGQERERPSEPPGRQNGRGSRPQPSPASPTAAGPTTSPSPTPASPSPSPQVDERRHDDRVDLPTGTAVTIGFVAGALSALGALGLVRRRRRQPGAFSAGWIGATTRSIRHRLLAATAPVGEEETARDPEEILRGIESPRDEVVLGHRTGTPVVARERGRIYSFGGRLDEVTRYLRDVVLHTAISHRQRVEVWTTNDVDLGEMPALRLFPDARSLVSGLEIEILRRHRLLDEEGVSDWEHHEREWPDDPLTIVLGVMAVRDDALQNRLRAVATQGFDLGMFVMTIAEDTPAFEVKEGAIWPVDATLGVGDSPFEPIRIAEEDRRALLEELGSASDDSAASEPVPAQHAPASGRVPTAPIRVRLFGRPAIEGPEESGDGFGPKSREVLFLFLLHPSGLTRDEAIEMLWPDVDPDKGIQRFKFQLQKIRSHFRSDELPTAKIIEKLGDALRPQAGVFEVDVWEFDRLLAQATDDMSERTLASAVELYRDDLLLGVYYPWADSLRAHFRERLLDILARLAELRSDRDDLEGAVDAIRRAISIDPFAEHLYRRAMKLYGALGRTSDVHRIYNELVALLADELEAEPDPETSDLKDQLLHPSLRSP